MLRSIVVFLLGAGFAAGAYMSGFAQRVPYYFSGLEHGWLEHGWSADRDAPGVGSPVMVRVSSVPDNSGCVPVYRVYNHTDDPVLLSLANGSAQGNEVRVPPGASLMPTGERDSAVLSDIAAPAAAGPESECIPASVKIELSNG
jgi:hypothetical protein